MALYLAGDTTQNYKLKKKNSFSLEHIMMRLFQKLKRNQLGSLHFTPVFTIHYCPSGMERVSQQSRIVQLHVLVGSDLLAILKRLGQACHPSFHHNRVCGSRYSPGCRIEADSTFSLGGGGMGAGRLDGRLISACRVY